MLCYVVHLRGSVAYGPETWTGNQTVAGTNDVGAMAAHCAGSNSPGGLNVENEW